MTDEVEKLRRLVIHRELQLLRATAVRTRGGRRWVRVRAKKLREAQEALARAEARPARKVGTE